MSDKSIAHVTVQCFVAAVCFLGVVVSAPSARAQQQTLDSRAAMERLKTLVGTWESTQKGGSGPPQRFTYTLTGRGTVLIEDGGGGGMASAYHLDNDQLVMTHYCGAGNQPRMRIKAADTRHIYFEMYDITNLSSPQAYHTTSLDVVFLGDDRVDLVYGGTTAGQPSVQTFQLTRKSK